ncbi:alpha/beta hydrolase family protein [Nonomuraea solani]|uniref:alpha/beta hydrolase family protein n=1 Tax=Nonomuraea solani TaxID=1144553 RepID=UPI000CDEF8F6|nr:alpha/beta hydrolase [Nonomuraea solani]
MDERVASAIAHWGPRFTANGVTVSDFERVTRDLDTWDEWCAAWSSVASEHEALGRQALATGRHLSAGQHLAQAALYFHFAKFVFVTDLDQARRAHLRAVACLDDALPHLSPPGRRIEIDFEGGVLAGILRLPFGPGPHPAVLMLSGLDSAKEEHRVVERLFLERGLATFAVDGPGQGECSLPIRGDWSLPGKALLDALAASSGVDRSRIGVWGVSLGGYYAPRVAAALGERVAACVALAGPYDFGDCWSGLPLLTRETFRVRAGASNEEEARRIAYTLTMEGIAPSITAPLLVVFGRKDRLIPWRQAERLAATAGGDSELLMLEEGNHGCANLAPWHRPYTADWLAQRLRSKGIS